MKFTLALLPLVISAVSGFVLPAGLHDGVYRSYIDDEGKEVHERLSPPAVGAAPVETSVSSPDDDPANILKRAPGTLYCGCGFTLDHAGCDAAVADMKRQVNGGVHVPAHSAYYSIQRGVVFFACSYGNGQLFIDPPTITSICSWITEACGWYIAGTYKYPAADGGAGYMRHSAGLDFCATSRSSSAHRC